MSLVYHVVEHRHLTGVRLSKSGSWTSLPFPDDDAAARYARKDADGTPYRIERKRVTKRLVEVKQC